MERLLDDAGRLANTKFDISSLEDVYTAIHVIQENMGITGTTSEEAAKTIEGSVGSMKAAWENLVTAFGVSEMPIDTYVTNFVDSISTAAENVVPRIGLIVKNIGEKLPGVLSRLFENLKKSIEKNDLGTTLLDGIDALVTNASTEIQKMFNSLFDGDTLSGLLTRATGTVGTITESLSNMFKTVLGRLPEIVSGAADILRNIGGTIWGTLMDTLTTLTEGDILTQIVDSVGGLIEDAVSRLAQDLPTIVSSLAAIVTKLIPQVVTSLVDNIEPIIHGFGTILTSIIDSITQDDGILDNLVTGISAIVDSIVDNIDPILLALDSVINTVLEKLLEPETMGKIMNSAANILAKVIVGAAKVLGSFTGFAFEFSQNLGETIGNAINQGVIEESLAGIGAGIIQALGIEEEFELGVEMIKGYIDEVKEYWETGWKSLEDFGAGVFDWFANIGESIINFADSIAQGVENITSGFTDNPILNGIKGFGDKVGNWLGFGDKEKQISNGFSNGSGGASASPGRNVTINFTQNNTSPQALDEYEIWRQNKRAMDDLRANLGGVW